MLKEPVPPQSTVGSSHITAFVPLHVLLGHAQAQTRHNRLVFINKAATVQCECDRQGARLVEAKALRNAEEITDKTGHRCWRGLGFVSTSSL